MAKVVHWVAYGGAERVAALRRELEGAGWAVTVAGPDGSESVKTIRAASPAAVVIDLAAKPSHGREVGAALRSIAATRAIPLLFVDGEPEAVEKTRAKLAFAAKGAVEPSYVSAGDLVRAVGEAAGR